MPATQGDRPCSLARFVAAQADVYPQALAELRAGRKTSHWMWFVFPQVAGLGRSDMARHYAIAGQVEAKAYLAHPVLGPRLAESTAAVMAWSSRRDITAILGEIDAIKFRSAMTLFEAAGACFCGTALDTFFNIERDALTLQVLAGEMA